jgi:hypothetical protein
MDQQTWQTYMAALAGTLQSAPTGPNMPVTVWNNLPLDVRISYVTQFGAQANMGLIPAGYAAVVEASPGDYFMLSTVATGSMAGVITISQGTSMAFFDPSDLLGPNDVGAPPAPNQQYVLPLDTPRALVATGVVGGQNIAMREQYWMRAPDSFSILPNEKQDISSTTTTALQRTSSNLDTIAASVGASASAGWGPVSASVSASLSRTSTRFQQVTVNTERTTYSADHIEGTGDNASYFLKWQLMDIVTVIAPGTGAILSSMVTGQAPILIAGPYSVDALPPAAPRPASAPKPYPRGRLPLSRALGLAARKPPAQAPGDKAAAPETARRSTER